MTLNFGKYPLMLDRMKLNVDRTEKKVFVFCCYFYVDPENQVIWDS